MSVHFEGGVPRHYPFLMDVDINIEGPEARVVVAGEVDAHTSPELARGFEEALAGGATSLIVDVAGVSFIDSSGLRVLVQTRQRVTDAGGTLELRQPTDTVVRLLELTGLQDLLGSS
jgi:anti-sigma B factor antagonist